ncbi:hypothetical protein BX600DRAFT_509020 [Xylariales sp. PMI_506]|nr:hypothetical protein BX600DRAFT_509020 [Xylariales sp. PMI_506]
MAKAYLTLLQQLQMAVRTKQPMATARKSPLNFSTARALRRAGLISWWTVGGIRAPESSLINSFSPDELESMNFWRTRNKNRGQIWMGLTTTELEVANGKEDKGVTGDESSGKRSAVTQSVLRSVTPLVKQLPKILQTDVLSQDDYRALIHGGSTPPLAVGKALDAGDMLFVVKTGESEDASEGMEVMEVREAARQGIESHAYFRVETALGSDDIEKLFDAAEKQPERDAKAPAASI